MNKLLCASLALGSLLCAGRTSPSTSPPPPWFQAHLEELMAEGGLSIADNGAYRSPNEPAEAYGVQWQWGVGRQSLVGRLFSLVDGKETGDIWQMRTFWHPTKAKAMAVQYGGDGTFVEGWLAPFEEGGVQVEQVLHFPDGSQQKVRHENSALIDGEHESRSFRWGKESWVPNRHYAWLLPETRDEQESR